MVVLDVREDIRRGDEPFARIMMAVKKLADDAALLLRVPFEPVPLYDVLGKRGLAHWTESRAADDWAVYFYRARAASPAPASSPGPPAARAANGATTLDVRDLEPPQPMIQILERLDSLRPGEELVVIHSRRPMLLYPQIEDRGFVHETDEPAPGTVRIRIRHGGGS